MTPELVTLRSPEELARLDDWCAISIGLQPGLPMEVVHQMETYGWAPGRRHTVVVRGGNAEERWIEVADPSYGLERWALKDLEKLWNGRALVLKKP
jgi:hypothetical protein